MGETTIYVNRYFEVRDHDQPTKYVFDGDTRVARVTGSLSNNARVQRLRLGPGWNLRALAVTAPDALHQLTNSQPAILDSRSIFQWSSVSLSWLPVLPDQSLPAGTILWLHATTNTTLAVTGSYADPTGQPVAAGGSFVPGSGLEALTLPAPGLDLTLWHHDAASQMWYLRAPAVPGPDAGFPQVLAPGEAVFINAAAPVELETPDAPLRVRYYHQDHLGSSSMITDANGEIVEETAFYPFGVDRHAHRPRQIEENYQFAQKERDEESGLHYFEARYLAGSIARFITADPKYARLDGLSSEDLVSFLSSPREINPYQYGLNNPLRYNDPTGLDKVDTVSTSADVVGIVAGGAEEAGIVAQYLGKTVPGYVNTGANVAGKATAAVSVGIKAVQFAQDPSYATGGQLANESAKALVGVAAPPVALIWSVLDLTGYGPSAILEHTEKSIQANRAATKSYQQATEASRQTVSLVNEAAPKIRAKHQQIEAKLQQLVRATDKLNQTTRQSLKGETRSLKELNDAIRKQERINRRTRAELRRVEAQARQSQD
jgi:RHS repeat-associated protein